MSVINTEIYGAGFMTCSPMLLRKELTMAASCVAKVDILLQGLGNEINKRVRFATTNTPEAVETVYGTVAATTPEAVTMGQVAHSLIDVMYIKAIDSDMYVSPTTLVSTGAIIKIAASEACMFRPYLADAVLSTGIWSATATAKYEAIIVGQSS
jgi:hypothetical protein